MIGKLFNGGLFLHQFKPFLDSRINSIRDAGYPDLAKAIVDDLGCLEHELQMLRELRDAGASSFIAANLDARLQTWRDTRVFAEFEFQVQRDRVDRVEANLDVRSSSLDDLDLSIASCETKIEQFRRGLREEEETLSILQMMKVQDQQAHTALSEELKSLKQKLVETEEIAAKTLATTEESLRAELQDELRQAYDEKLSKFSQQIFSHRLDV
ncbi:uncharacterized protein A4U43_C06F16640 [Asparagus officinalis]|uniref:Uncharacterized protein n=1 Tax=Asparagus officinalis TaxID=4686 RepID=A0A5P1ESX7_ASPOF|nr:uncharacterized protein A4U43_C06F16640 [Asparagus officinalis]